MYQLQTWSLFFIWFTNKSYLYLTCRRVIRSWKQMELIDSCHFQPSNQVKTSAKHVLLLFCHYLCLHTRSKVVSTMETLTKIRDVSVCLRLPTYDANWPCQKPWYWFKLMTCGMRINKRKVPLHITYPVSECVGSQHCRTL